MPISDRRRRASRRRGVEPQADDEDSKPGNGRDPPLVKDDVAAGGDHGSPFGDGRLRAEAEEAEAGRGQNDAGHVEGQPHDHRGEAERHDVAPQDAEHRGALQLRGENKLGAAQGDCLGASDPRIGRPCRHGDRQDRVLDPGLQCGDESEREHEAGKGHEDVGDAHEHAIDDAAGVA